MKPEKITTNIHFWLRIVVAAPAHSGIGGPLTYRSELPLAPGQLVRVPLGRREVLGLDWTVNLARARALVGGAVGRPGKALQGNIDPNVLFAQPAQIEAEVASVLNSFGKPHTDATTTGPTHIFNLGHGISQFTPPEHVAALVNAVHTHSRRLRQSA